MPKNLIDPLAIQDSYMDKDFAEAMEAVVIPKDEASNRYIAPAAMIQRNARTLSEWAPVWLTWASLLTPLILSDFQVDRYGKKRTDRSISHIIPEPVEHPESLVVVAPGPSLDASVKHLANFKGYIMASVTALPILYANGVRPHYCVAVDGNASLGRLLKQAPYESWGCKLLIPNTVCYDVADSFSRERYWFKSFIQGNDGGNNPFNRFMDLLHPWISSWIFQAGSVTNAMFLLGTCLNLAGYHDIKKIFLFGADYGHLEGKTRATNYLYDERTERWFPTPDPGMEYATRNAPAAMGANGVSSDIGMLGYKRALYTIWHLQGRQSFKVSIGPHKDEERTTPCLYSCSSGILFELPWCDPKDVCSDSGAAVELYGEDLINSTYKDYVLTTGKIEGQIREDFEIPKEAEDVQEE